MSRLHRQAAADILRAQLTADTTLIGNDTPPCCDVVAARDRANRDLFGILFVSTELHVHISIRRHMGKAYEVEVGNEKAVWVALKEI